MTELRQQKNSPEQNIPKHLSQNKKFNQIPHNYRKKDHSKEKQPKGSQEVGKKKKIWYVRNLDDTVTESDLGKLLGLRTTNFLKYNCSIEMSK